MSTLNIYGMWLCSMEKATLRHDKKTKLKAVVFGNQIMVLRLQFS